MLTPDSVLALLITYKYEVIFPVAIVEGPIIAVLSGFLSSTGVLNPFLVYGMLLLGDIVGDTLYYILGRWGGNPFFKRYGHWFGVDEKRLLDFEAHFKTHGDHWLWFGKTQAFGVAILAAAGVTRMPYFRFIGINLVGSSIKILGLFLIGYFFGSAYNQIDQTIHQVGVISIGIGVTILIAILLYRRKSSIS